MPENVPRTDGGSTRAVARCAFTPSQPLARSGWSTGAEVVGAPFDRDRYEAPAGRKIRLEHAIEAALTEFGEHRAIGEIDLLHDTLVIIFPQKSYNPSWIALVCPVSDVA